jgi:hypothetical protein
LLLEFVNEYGVRVIGGCCGTREEHIALIDEKLQSPAAQTAAPESASRAGLTGAGGSYDPGTSTIPDRGAA